MICRYKSQQWIKYSFKTIISYISSTPYTLVTSQKHVKIYYFIGIKYKNVTNYIVMSSTFFIIIIIRP